MATTANDFASLINFVENKTSLFNNKDFFARRLKNKTREMPHPENFMRISLPIKGFDEKTKQKKFDYLMGELEKLNLCPIPNGKRILLEIPKRADPAYNVERTQPPKPNLEPFDVYQKRFEELKNLHEKLPIFGVANIDQPDVGKGVAYFNYFNKEEAEKALKLFSEIGFGVEKRVEKECNLTFVLMLDSIDTTNLPFGRGKLNGRTIDVFQWIIKKIYRKIIESLPEGVVSGISGRGIVDCGEPEIFQIKKELEEKFGIIMIIHMSAKKRSEFFILTTPEATEVYKRFNGGISSCDLISILKNPETETEIKVKYKPKPETMTNEKDYLTDVLRKTFRNAKIELLQDHKEGEKVVCIQLRRNGDNQADLCANYGTLQERRAITAKAVNVIVQSFPGAVTEVPGTGTKATIFIPGYVNGPERKKRVKVVAEKPVEVTPKTIPGLTGTNERLPVLDAVLSGRPFEYSEEELQLKRLVDDPESFKMLEPEVVSEIHNYFIKKRVNEHARFLLAELQK